MSILAPSLETPRGPWSDMKGGKREKKTILQITLSQSFSQILPPALFHWTFSIRFCTYILEHLQCMFCTKAWKICIFSDNIYGCQKIGTFKGLNLITCCRGTEKEKLPRQTIAQKHYLVLPLTVYFRKQLGKNHIWIYTPEKYFWFSSNTCKSNLSNKTSRLSP